jgi:hypothetical protein
MGLQLPEEPPQVQRGLHRTELELGGRAQVVARPHLLERPHLLDRPHHPAKPQQSLVKNLENRSPSKITSPFSAPGSSNNSAT